MSTTLAKRFAPVYSIALVLLALVALIYVAAALPIESLSELRFKSLSWWAFVTIALLHLTYLLLAAEIWRRMVQITAGARIGYAAAYLQMVAVAIGKYVPGKIWGFIGRTAQLQRNDVPVTLTIMSSIVEQVLVLAGGAVIVIIAGMIAFPERIDSIGLLAAALFLGIMLITTKIPTITLWLLRKSRYAEIRDKVGSSFSLLDILRFTAGYSVLWLISGLILNVIFFSLFDFAVTAERVSVLVLANTIGFVVGFFAIFAPSGLGVREATTVAVLAPFFPVREVFVATVMLRALIVLFDGVNAVIMLIAESRQSSKYTN